MEATVLTEAAQA